MFVSEQIALNAATPTALWQIGGAAPPVVLTSQGNVQDPVPVLITCPAAIYLGGPNVTPGDGFLLPANTILPLSFFGANELLYAIASTGTPSASLLFGRQ